MRRHLTFPCNAAALAATLDEAPGTTGLLIVSGGNEIRSGAHRSMAELAARIAKAGNPVFRFDRRGIGDSDGANGGYTDSRDDILAAITTFRTIAPHVTRIVAFGNCDAASALLLHQPLALDSLILANPWTYEDEDEDDDSGTNTDGDAAPALPPASAIRARYLDRLRDPKSLLRLVKGEVDLRKLMRGLAALGKKKPPPADDSLTARLANALSVLPAPATILLANGDRTAMAFDEALDTALFALSRDDRIKVERLDSPSHSFAGTDADWLAERILEKLG